MSTVEEALERFDALFDEAWALASETEARIRTSDPLRAGQLRALLRQLHRSREEVLHGDWRPGAPGGGLGLAGMVGRGFELDLDPDPGVRGAGEAARALERAFDDGLGLSEGPGGRPVGWEAAVRQRPPTPPAPQDEPAGEPPRRRWWRGGR